MNSSQDHKMTGDQELSRLILNDFPYPIAVNYKRIMEAKTWQEKTEGSLHVFDFILRALGLAMVSQYLVHDRDKDFSDSTLNDLLRKKLPKPSLGHWVEILFSTLKVYGANDQNLFMTELSQSLWDKRSKKAKGRGPFENLVKIRNELKHRLPPRNEEGWKFCFEDIIENLNMVFLSVRFLTNYNLIKSIENTTERTYQIYRGQEIREFSEPLEASHILDEGWFYFSKDDLGKEKCLKLYPFLVSWDEDIDSMREGAQTDTALLERFTDKTIHYTAPVLWKNLEIQEEELLADFYYSFQAALDEKRKRSKGVTWKIIKESARKISQKRMGELIDKYDPQLYLQREEVKEVFEDFLHSEKTCLVLTGKSGVGKSNFVLSLSDAYEDNDSICVLLYNGASSIFNEYQLSDLIYSDFNNLIELKTAHWWIQSDIWQIVNSIPDIQEKYFILIVDAINENLNPTTVLQKIDSFIDMIEYPWLKIVITSRPEAWRTLTHKMRLADHKYYWNATRQELGVEIKEFKLAEETEKTVSIVQFTKSELEEVYLKYQERFQMKTDFNDIPYSVKRILQDPLVLKLVSTIFKQSKIPSDISISEIYQDYIVYLQETKRLDKKDLFFLETSIVNVLVEKLVNSLSEEMVYSDPDLFEKIFNDDKLSDNQPVNFSFMNLVDTEILAPIPEIGAGSVSFKYERFYEHFCGKKLYEIYKDSERGNEYLKAVIETANEKTFLLGVIRNAIERELQAGQIDAILSLASSPFALSRDIVTSVLSEFGLRNRAYSKDLLSKIYQNETENEDLADEEVNQTMVAINVAGNLCVSEVLEKGIRSKYPQLRTASIWQVYWLWVKDREKGWRILQALMDEIIHMVHFDQLAWNVVRKKARFDNIESAGFLSIHILTNHSQEEGITEKLRSVWKPVIQKVLFYSADNTIKERINNRLRELILSSLINVVLGRISYFPTRYNPAGIAEFDAYYNLPNPVKEKFSSLVEYLDPNFGDLPTLEKQIIDLYPTNNGLISLVIGHLLVAQSKKDLDGVLEVAKNIFNYGFELKSPNIFSGNMFWVTGTISRIILPDDSRAFFVFKELLTNSIEKVDEWRGSTGKYANVWLDDYARFYFDKYGDPHVELICRHTQNLIESKKYIALYDLLFVVGRLSSSPLYWKVVLEVIKILAVANLEEIDEEEGRKIVDQIVELLARIRFNKKEIMDDFLNKYFPESEIRQRVLVKKAQEDIFESLGGGSGPWVAFSVKTIHTEAYRQDIIWLLKVVATTKNFGDALKTIVRWAINLIYGEPVFNLAKKTN